MIEVTLRLKQMYDAGVPHAPSKASLVCKVTPASSSSSTDEWQAVLASVTLVLLIFFAIWSTNWYGFPSFVLSLSLTHVHRGKFHLDIAIVEWYARKHLSIETHRYC